MKEGGYAIYVDAQTYGSSSTGGNFAIILLGKDDFDGVPLVTETEEQHPPAAHGEGGSWAAHRRQAVMASHTLARSNAGP
jgi:hypothetical protein